MRRIGIDVGGTNTDAVLVHDATVVASVMTPTTDDVTAGVRTALRLLGPFMLKNYPFEEAFFRASAERFRATLSLPLPANPTVAGIAITAQVMTLGSALPPGIDLSNGVLLQLGN